MNEESLGFAHLWQQGDSVAHGVAILLLLMSVLTWYVILLKAWQHLTIRRRVKLIDEFWAAASLAEAVNLLLARSPGSPAAIVAQRGYVAAGQCAQQAARPERKTAFGQVHDASEFLTRALRQGIAQGMARLESGLAVLASIGSTAPFVGLFGTVWGIYHALIRIGASGSAGIDQIAGPVGEALLMTALGLAVAIPAVLAYNACARANRNVAGDLDAFAHDLHAQLVTGALEPAGNAITPLRGAA